MVFVNVFYLTEIRRRGSKDLLKVCVLVEAGEGTMEEGPPMPLQIYDIPYEGNGDGDKMAVTRPELDPRPSSEYELPWEWKKEHIVRTLSGMMSVTLHETLSQTEIEHRSNTGNTTKGKMRMFLLLSTLDMNVLYFKLVHLKCYPYPLSPLVCDQLLTNNIYIHTPVLAQDQYELHLFKKQLLLSHLYFMLCTGQQHTE